MFITQALERLTFKVLVIHKSLKNYPEKSILQFQEKTLTTEKNKKASFHQRCGKFCFPVHLWRPDNLRQF